MKHTTSLSLTKVESLSKARTAVYIICSIPILAGLLAQSPALGESAFLRKGIAAYTAGDYDKAAGLLGAAQSAEFDNPVLHYYLANTLARLKEHDGAIREYRIAYALDPDGDVGRQSRLALSVYGTDLFGSKHSKRGNKDPMTAFGKITFSSDPVIQQAVVAMHKQVDQLSSTYNNTQPNYSGGRGMSVLRRAYAWQNSSLAQDNARSTSAAYESANNLEKLLNNHSSRNTVKLDPAETNLYIRKYSYPPSNNPDQATTTVSGKLINKTPSSGKE